MPFGIKAQTTGTAQKPTTALRQSRDAGKLMRAEAVLDRAIRSKEGITRVAAAMTNPVRRMLDYKAIFRQLVVVETGYPESYPFIYDKDLAPYPSIKVGPGGTSRMLDAVPERMQIEEFEIISRVKVPYKELYTRRYKVLNRAKERLAEGVGIQEDLLGFALINDASQVGGDYGNAPIQEDSALSKGALSRAFAQLKARRLLPRSILVHPIGTSGIQRWLWNEIDQDGLKEIRQSGYLGNLWGANFFESDLMTTNKAFVLADPELVGWMPIRRDVEIQDAPDPDQLRLGFVAYELLGMTVTNVSGVASVQFNDTK